MIYRLNDAFTKIEEKEGIMQNLNRHAEIEVVSCVDDPKKDSGLLLMPMEKLKFCTKEEESLYARCAEIDGTNANLSVVNFNVPAMGDSVAGCENHGFDLVTLFEGRAIPSSSENYAVLTLNDSMANYDFLVITSYYGGAGFSDIVYVPHFRYVSKHAEHHNQKSFCKITKLSDTSIGQNYWTVVTWGTSVDGIHSVVGLKRKCSNINQ